MRSHRFVAILISALLLLGMFTGFAAVYGFTPPSGWSSYKEVTLTETIGLARVSEPVEVVFEPEFGTCSSTDEIRVIAPDEVTEIPSQVYDVTTSGGYITSCKVVFLADCPALSTVTYYIIYNNPTATTPTYDGLRLYEEAAGDTYTINATKLGVEKRYFRIFWKAFIDLYSNGEKVTSAGGPPGWEFSQINLGTMWSDAWGGLWFGTWNGLSVLNSGPVFVDLEFSQLFASDLWGTVFDFNVSYTNVLRVYYQPEFNPLVKYDSTFHINTNLANYTIKGMVYMDFKLANSTSQAIYKDFVYNEGWFGTTVIPAEDFAWKSVWYPPWGIYGWWSYNGSRADSTDKPKANMGLVPIDSIGTLPAESIQVSNEILDADHHCTQWVGGTFNGVYGDTAAVTGYIVTTTPVDGDTTAAMNDKAGKLRTPLTVFVLPTLAVYPSLSQFQTINKTFSVNVTINGLSEASKAVGFGFKLTFDGTMLEVVSVELGPYMEDPAWNLEGVFWIYFIEDEISDPLYGPCVSFGTMLIPNATGHYGAYLSGSGVIATVTFNIINWERGLERPPLSCGLNLEVTQVIDEDTALIPHTVLNGLFENYPTNIGDINFDGVVDMRDVGIAALAFGSHPGHPRWNPEVDTNGDEQIDMRDIALVARNFGWTPTYDP
ncbi:MAG: hypothetical protein PVH12_00115 [Candidatus Bathyarchaeota archaeon]|jgi:hypothetical protein